MLAEALAGGISPVEYMLTIMRDENAEEGRRAWAAEKAAPYLHPRPTPTDRTIRIGLPDTSTLEGIDKALDTIISAIASGDIAPAEGHSLIAVIEARRKAIETTELAERIERLEEAAADRS